MRIPTGCRAEIHVGTGADHVPEQEKIYSQDNEIDMPLSKIRQAVKALAGHRVMIVGDLMLDHYLIGQCDRISPEAPVPVVRVRDENVVLGGAGNVARNIAALGGSPLLIAAVGNDPDGKILQDLCVRADIATRLIRESDRPTTKKTRIMAQNQQVVRVDHERSAPLGQDSLDQLFNHLQAEIAEYPVVILSDYGKGFISREFMDRFMALVEETSPRPLVLVDPKTVNYDLYTGVDLLTPNTKEAGEGAGILVDGRESVVRAGELLFDRLDCHNLLITLGGDGMALFEGRDHVCRIPTFAQKVFDVTGAGDTVIATVALALSAGSDLLTACTVANYAAGIVVGQVGAASTSRSELLEAVNELPEPSIEQWKSA